MATTIFRRDHLMRNVVDPTGTAKDHLGRVTTSTVDHLGRALVVEVWAGTHAVVVGEYVQITSTGIVYKVVASGTTAAGEPTAPAVGATVVSGTATLERITSN
jgi:hypothetical protein